MMMNSLFSRHITTVGLLLTLFMGVTVECVNAQEAPKPTTPKRETSSLTDEEWRQIEHKHTMEAFKKLEAASAAKEQADCEGTPEDKKKADRHFRHAKDHFYRVVEIEAWGSEKAKKAAADAEEKYLKLEAAKANKDAPQDDIKKAEQQSKNAHDDLDKVRKEERERILREYTDDLKKLAKCEEKKTEGKTEHKSSTGEKTNEHKTTDKKKGRKKTDDTANETAGGSRSGISIDISGILGGGHRKEQGNEKIPRSDDLRRKGQGDGFGTGGGGGITFGR
jgi:hypothetical protein